MVLTLASFNALQRLKPNDPVLSFRACERHTFSMRHDREVWSQDMYSPLCGMYVEARYSELSGKRKIVRKSEITTKPIVND